jgi:hypothetical protein
LTTLLATGRIGKSRLSSEAGRIFPPAFRHVAHFIELASIENPKDIAIAIAKHLAIELDDMESSE